MFGHMKFLTLRASFAAVREGRLPPYLGSTLRGLLGHCMREFVCDAPQRRCYLCSERNGCSYARCFCSPGNEGGAVNPYVLHALVHGKTEWKIGDRCIFDLTLIGNVTQYAGVFLDALQAMENRGWGVERIPFQLEYVIEPQANRLIFNNGKVWMRNLNPCQLAADEHMAQTALVHFDTPVRILEKKQLCQSLSFTHLIQSLSRRIALLSQAYTDQIVQWEEDAMLEAAGRIETIQEDWRLLAFKRYSMNQEDNALSLPAIDGWARYEGDITPFTPLLEAGRILHAGKNSTIGFGHFNVVYDR